jgi:putative endonuclease
MDNFWVYIIYSLSLDKFYVGYTTDLEKRLTEHNTGISTFTSKATDWELKLSEAYQTREKAMKREKQIKTKKSRKYTEWLINSAG